MQTSDGGPAYPVECNYEGGRLTGGMQTGPCTGWVTGVSVRDWFAGKALQGMLASDRFIEDPPEKTAKCAYMYADAMLAARTPSTEGEG